MLFSAKTKSFYDPTLKYAALPDDATKVERQVYLALMDAQAHGKRIETTMDGSPIAVDDSYVWNGTVWVIDNSAVKSSLKNRNRDEAKLQLNQVLSAPVEFDGVLFQYDKEGKDSILETLKEAEILGVTDEESTPWRLADNSVRETSVADLKSIVALGAVRRREANAKYSAWTQTDMQEPFTLEA